MKKLFAALTAAAALSLSISLPASAEGGTGISIDGTSYGSIAEAVAAAAEGATILLEDGSYEAAGIDLTKDVTIQGSGSTNILVPDKGGEDFGFRIADGAAVTFDGLNITADELTERFIRGDISRNTEGSGLGLSIAKDLVQLQGGTFNLYLDGDLFKVTIEFKMK